MTKKLEAADNQTAEAFARAAEALVQQAIDRSPADKRARIAAAVNADEAVLAIAVSLEEPILVRVFCQDRSGDLLADMGTLVIERKLNVGKLH